MKFSIIIPVYNSENTIVKTIESCLEQSYKNFEIIIIDDCSTDKSVEIITTQFRDYRIKIISLAYNQGVSNARNVGWDNAVGEFVAFLDADDLWHRSKLEHFNHLLKIDSSITCAGNLYTDNIQKFGHFLPLKNNRISYTKLLVRNYFNTSCLIVKKSLNYRFNSKMRYTEDHELLLRISESEVIFLENAYLTLLGRPQLSDGGLSGNKWKMRKGELKMFMYAARRNYYVAFILPGLIAFSLIKHVSKILK